MDYDFRINTPVLGEGWTNMIGEWTANDGRIVSNGCRGVIIDSDPFMKWAEPSAQPWLDHLHWWMETTGPVTVRKGDVIGAEWRTAVQTFRTDQSPFPAKYIEENDLRLGAGMFLALDFISGLSFGFILTNDRIYGVYMKFFTDEVVSSWTYVMPLKARKPCEISKIRLEFNEGCKEVAYQIGDMEYYRIKKVGERLTSNQLLVKDYGGEGVLAFPTQLTFGFGTVTALDWYPACRESCCGGDCHFPLIRQGLVNLGNSTAPQAYSVIEGPSVNQTYYQNDGDIEVYHIWGQGVKIDMGGFKVNRYACFY
jgi:hypothetical protein